MKWTQLSVCVSNEVSDAVSNILDQLNHFNGIQIKNQGEKIQLITYFPSEKNIKSKVNLLEAKISELPNYGLNLGDYEIKTKIVDDEKWGIAWEPNYQVTKVTRFLTIVPEWKKYHHQFKDEIILKLDPKKAFGTGAHPTTQLTLQALETCIRGGEHVLDVGTGSGILSIAAVKLGALDAKGFDVTEDAIKSARRNVKLNHVSDKVVISTNNLLNHVYEQSNLIVANMLSKFILPLIPQASHCLRQRGLFIISGIINTDLSAVVRELKLNHFDIEQILSKNSWQGIIARKLL